MSQILAALLALGLGVVLVGSVVVFHAAVNRLLVGYERRLAAAREGVVGQEGQEEHSE